jgi:hypothetical protein
MFQPTSTVAALLCAGSAFAQSACLDQSYLPSALINGLEVTANQPVTQTFTVGRTGHLLQVEVSRIRHHNGISTNPLTVDVVTTDATGTPTTTVLASVVVQPSVVTTTISPLLIDLATFNVQVQAGQVLGLALSSPNPPGTPSYAWWGVAPGGGYAGGRIYIQGTLALDAWDLAFQTWVSVPASWNNYGAGHPGTAGVPSLTSSAAPVLGTTPNLQLGNSLGQATLGAVFLGVATLSVPTPWGGAALVDPLASFGLALPPGGGSLAFPVPSDPLLCGFEVFAQGVVLDAGATQGIALTAGLRLVLGD